jgi:hypothetical protein
MTFVRGYSDARQPSTTLLPRSNHLLSTASFSAVQHRWSVSAHTRIRRSRSPPYTSPPRVLEVLSFLRTESIRGLCDRPQIPNSVSCEPPFSLFLAISSQQRPNRRVRPPVLTAADLEKGYRRCSRTTSQLLVDRTSNHRLLVARTDFGNAPLPDSEPGASGPQHRAAPGPIVVQQEPSTSPPLRRLPGKPTRSASHNPTCCPSLRSVVTRYRRHSNRTPTLKEQFS